jgi:hypothetical protein
MIDIRARKGLKIILVGKIKQALDETQHGSFIKEQKKVIKGQLIVII